MLDILSQYGDSTVKRIQVNMASTGTNASGKTSQSVRFHVESTSTKQTLTILGRAYFFAVETGRKDTPQYEKPSKEFVQSIQDWMNAKGIPGPAYAIAKSIHAKGTRLFRAGGRKDIVSNVVNQSLIESIEKDVLNRYADIFLKNSVNILTGGHNLN